MNGSGTLPRCGRPLVRVSMSREPYKQACVWEQEADPWAGMPHDSALHGWDSCFTSMGCHKFHPGAFFCRRRRRCSSASPSVSSRLHTSTSFLLPAASFPLLFFFFFFLPRVDMFLNLVCSYVNVDRANLGRCAQGRFRSLPSLLRLNLLIHCVMYNPANLTQCVYLCGVCVLARDKGSKEFGRECTKGSFLCVT